MSGSYKSAEMVKYSPERDPGIPIASYEEADT